jgi:hypothetical protein
MESQYIESNTHELNDLKAQILSHSIAISNPLSSNKQIHYQKLQELSWRLLELKQIPYHCKQCKFQHRKGTVYHEHKSFAEIILPFQPVKIHTVDHNLTLLIQKYRSEEADETLASLSSGTALTLEIEEKLYVKYQNIIIGEITTREKRFHDIIEGLESNNTTIKCYLEDFQPKEIQRVITELVVGNKVEERHVSITERKPEELWISIHIFHAQKYKEVFEGLMELLDFHPDLLPAFLALGPRVVKDLETYGAECNRNVEYKEKIADMVDKLHSHFKIDMGTQYSIML